MHLNTTLGRALSPKLLLSRSPKTVARHLLLRTLVVEKLQFSAKDLKSSIVLSGEKMPTLLSALLDSKALAEAKILNGQQSELPYQMKDKRVSGTRAVQALGKN